MNLAAKHRPTSYDDVVGQDPAVAALRGALENGQQAILFAGPSGVGKTTLARIMVADLGIIEVDEIDAASNTGIDAMRNVSQRAHYFPMEGKGKAFIIDECHRLSKQAWDSLLKDVEEPPANVFWIFCTTEPTKVPPTIRTRCAQITLSHVSTRDIAELVRNVATREQMTAADDVLALVARSAAGSPRRALVNLAAVSNVTDTTQARHALRQSIDLPAAIDFARMLFSSERTLQRACDLIGKMKDENAESVRITIFSYATAVAVKDGDQWALKVMGAFEHECLEQNRMGDLLLRTARLFWKK